MQVESNFSMMFAGEKPAKTKRELGESSLFKRGSYINIIVGFSCCSDVG